MNYLKKSTERLSRWFLEFPARISIGGFILLISIGTFLLMLPISSAGVRMGFTDAMFTAASAACVTGLAVADTGTFFSPFGQTVILILIQAGGLGIMTLSTLILLIAGKRPGMTDRLVIQDTFTHRKEQGAAEIIRDVMVFALIPELIGVIILFFCFLPGNSAGRAVWLSVFHSVSAFCNAGFSLFSDSLVQYREDWMINLTVCFLIITGGIGFLVLSELRRLVPFKKDTWHQLSLHSKLALSTTAVLLAVSTLLILMMEWRNTLAPLSVPGRFLSAFFQAVSARTAGFNSLPVEALADETLFLVIMLMFIGACPGSCAGGVKTTTFSTLVLLGFSRIRGYDYPQIFRRTIPVSAVWKAVSLVILSMMLISGAVMLLMITELGDISHLKSKGKFLEYLFEVVSAFGTVGLSTGVTGGLSVPGKLIITVLMFVGRLGPLVIGIAISRKRVSLYHHAEEDIMIG
ncbi:MAG: TrkH family potassium uptake protein [Desulfococcaceae bacterium]